MKTTQMQTRAGRYVAQDGGYRAFIPNPLPPHPPIDLRGKMQVLLSQADRALGRLDGSIQMLPHPDLFVAMYVRKEAVLSSQIEGTQSSLHDVLAAEARIFSPDLPRDVDEVINYVRAMNRGLKCLEDGRPISIRLLREIHEELLTGTRGQDRTPGELRLLQNWIGPPGSTLSDAAFVPPPPHEVPNALTELERFLQEDTSLPLLIRVGLVHAQFETIHPFRDGNGRLGRLLITLMLCDQKALIRPVLYLSHFFKGYRQEYYDHLQYVRDQGDWESWLTFFLTGVFVVSQQATRTARRILTMREHHRQMITAQLGRTAGNGHRVLEHLYQKPFISVAEVQALLASTYPVANNIVTKLIEHGILQEITGGKRNRRFKYTDYVNLFIDEPIEDGGIADDEKR